MFISYSTILRRHFNRETITDTETSLRLSGERNQYDPLRDVRLEAYPGIYFE